MLESLRDFREIRVSKSLKMLYLALFPFESPLFSSAPMIAWFHLSGSQGQKKYKVFLMPPCLPLRRQLSPRLKALDVYIYH